MRGQKLSQQPAHVREADRIDRRDRKTSSRRFVQRANFALQVVVPLNNDACPFMEPLAFRSDNERPLRAIDQLYAKPFLKMVNDLAGVRLRNVIELGRTRKAAMIHDVAECFQKAQMHSVY